MNAAIARLVIKILIVFAICGIAKAALIHSQPIINQQQTQE